jgi:hypothetical protein
VRRQPQDAHNIDKTVWVPSDGRVETHAARPCALDNPDWARAFDRAQLQKAINGIQGPAAATRAGVSTQHATQYLCRRRNEQAFVGHTCTPAGSARARQQAHTVPWDAASRSRRCAAQTMVRTPRETALRSHQGPPGPGPLSPCTQRRRGRRAAHQRNASLSHAPAQRNTCSHTERVRPRIGTASVRRQTHSCKGSCRASTATSKHTERPYHPRPRAQAGRERSAAHPPLFHGAATSCIAAPLRAGRDDTRPAPGAPHAELQHAPRVPRPGGT